MCAWCLRSEGGIGSLGTRVRGGCEPPSGCWEANLDPLREQHTLFCAESLLLCLSVVLTWVLGVKLSFLGMHSGDFPERAISIVHLYKMKKVHFEKVFVP